MAGVAPDILDTADPDQVAAYERAFHRGCQRARGNGLIRRLWRWDEAGGRVATAIPYDEQVVYLQRDGDGRLCAAMAVNVAMRNFQAAAFGFQPPADGGRYCEVLTIFAIHDHGMANRRVLVESSFADLRRRGFSSALATAARRLAVGYCRYFGSKILAQAEISGETRFFLAFDLNGRA